MSLPEWDFKVTVFLNMTPYSLAGTDISHELTDPFFCTLKMEAEVSS